MTLVSLIEYYKLKVRILMVGGNQVTMVEEGNQSDPSLRTAAPENPYP